MRDSMEHTEPHQDVVGNQTHAKKPVTFYAEESAQHPRRRDALKRFMLAKDITPAEWARLAGLPRANQLYNFLNGHSLALSQRVLEKLLAVFPGATMGELIGETPVINRSQTSLTVRMAAEAGTWTAFAELPLADQYDIALPHTVRGSFAVRVSDRHADAIIPPRSHVVIEEIAAFDGALYSGMLVLMRRRRGKQNEVTLRELTKRDGEWWLVGLSTDPELKVSSIRAPWPYNGQVWEVGNERVQIIGVATDAMIALVEPNRS